MKCPVVVPADGLQGAAAERERGDQAVCALEVERAFHDGLQFVLRQRPSPDGDVTNGADELSKVGTALAPPGSDAQGRCARVGVRHSSPHCGRRLPIDQQHALAERSDVSDVRPSAERNDLVRAETAKPQLGLR